MQGGEGTILRTVGQAGEGRPCTLREAPETRPAFCGKDDGCRGAQLPLLRDGRGAIPRTLDAQPEETPEGHAGGRGKAAGGTRSVCVRDDDRNAPDASGLRRCVSRPRRCTGVFDYRVTKVGANAEHDVCIDAVADPRSSASSCRRPREEMHLKPMVQISERIAPGVLEQLDCVESRLFVRLTVPDRSSSRGRG